MKITSQSKISFIVSIVVLYSAAAAGSQTFTYPELVSRMTDLKQLASLPLAGEKTSLASSYDRHSKYDPQTDRYLNWGANDDGSGIVAKESDTSVLMDMQGPGCIWRTWSATAGRGHVKIFIDGADQPTVDLPFAEYFDAKHPPFDRPNLVYIPSPAAHGFDNFTPIPFQKSCKIVAEKGWGSYYQFTWTQFPATTTVPSFKMNLSPDDSAALDAADRKLAHCGTNPIETPKAKTETLSVHVEPGESATVLDLPDAGAITAIHVQLELPTDIEQQRILLRQLTISIRWDAESSPAVWSPLGDFFGYVGGAGDFKSLPTGTQLDNTVHRSNITFYSFWYMPFSKGAHLEIGNDGPTAISTAWEIKHESLPGTGPGLGRFHAKWHRDAFLTTRKDRWPDWTLLTTQGTGRYVGTHLHGWNPRGNWWGEGDDKFFVDGEKFPSSFGTGSEDYFGYAWSSDAFFSRPYHNQILNESNAGHFVDNRWHISDSVPFSSSFEADIEKYFSNQRPTLYAAEAYWYLSPGGTDPYQPVPVSDRVGYWVRPSVFHEPGAIEAESLPLASKPQHAPLNQEMTGFGNNWSGEHQLFWRPNQTGETLELQLPTQKPGKYRLIARCTLAPDYGTFQFTMNGTDIGKAIDLYGKAVKAGDPMDVGIVQIAEGNAHFKVTVTGKNAASSNTFFGLDYLKLIPAE